MIDRKRISFGRVGRAFIDKTNMNVYAIKVDGRRVGRIQVAIYANERGYYRLRLDNGDKLGSPARTLAEAKAHARLLLMSRAEELGLTSSP